MRFCCLPLRGGSGLKCLCISGCCGLLPSPSARREWIEIEDLRFPSAGITRLPLRGGSGLKSLVIDSKACECRLPLRGGSGLKFGNVIGNRIINLSPSARREWIEIPLLLKFFLVLARLPLRGGSGLKSVKALRLSALK